MNKLDAMLVIYLRFFSTRGSGNYYAAEYNNFIIELLKLHGIQWTACRRKPNKICLTYDYDCSELNHDMLNLSDSVNDEICRVILSSMRHKKFLEAKSENEATIIQAMFGKIGYLIRITNKLHLVPVGNFA